MARQGYAKVASIVGARIREARTALHLSQKELGARSGISEKMVSQYELYTNAPSAKYIRELSRALGVSADWLLGLSDLQNPRAEAEALSRALGVVAQTVRCVFGLEE